MCLGLNYLNKANNHKHPKAKVLEEVTHRISGFKAISKLDAHNRVISPPQLFSIDYVQYPHRLVLFSADAVWP